MRTLTGSMLDTTIFLAPPLSALNRFLPRRLPFVALLLPTAPPLSRFIRGRVPAAATISLN